jgi:hypothetical protein
MGGETELSSMSNSQVPDLPHQGVQLPRVANGINGVVPTVAHRPRFDCDSQARTLQLGTYQLKR